jgi:hypothetical protein
MNVGPPRLTLGQRLRNAAYWFITAFDDVLIERFWRPLRAGQPRSAFGALAETILGWWGCALAFVIGVAALVVVLS